MSQDIKFYNFMGIRKYTSGFSIILSIICLISIGYNGFNLGLDFTGGTQLQIALDRPADIPTIRHVLEEEKLRTPTAVIFGSDKDVMIRTQDTLKDKGEAMIRDEIAKIGANVSLKSTSNASREQFGVSKNLLIANATPAQLEASGIFTAQRFGRVQMEAKGSDTNVAVEKGLEVAYSQHLQAKISEATQAQIEVRSSEEVGPQIGTELYNKGGMGMLVAFLGIFLYVAVQFQWKFSAGALVSLVHDTIVVLGLFSIFKWEFDLTVLAAVLALIGYSINDTIVIFDRVRENFRKMRKVDAETIVNISMTQTLERSIMTHVTVLLVVLVLFFFGGELLHGFSKAMLIGVIFGTYSSIYIAANTTVALGISKEDLMPPVKEGAEADVTP